jgi:molecular chaperone GrpE (heat shock protein)
MSTETWVYLLTGIIGGTGVSSLFKYMTTRRFQSISLEERLRAEMLQNNKELRDEIATLKNELDQWRDKYLNLHKEYTKLKSLFDKIVKDK